VTELATASGGLVYWVASEACAHSWCRRRTLVIGPPVYCRHNTVLATL